MEEPRIDRGIYRIDQFFLFGIYENLEFKKLKSRKIEKIYMKKAQDCSE
jgi:hypothetical protein